jgi:hypothetical protein
MIVFRVDEVNRARANMEGTYLFSWSSNHDAWETNDLFPTDVRRADFSLALYDCLSACQSKGRNSAASGTSVSLRLPINVNATVSISNLLSLLNSFRLDIIRRLALIDNYYFLYAITKSDVSLASLFPRVICLIASAVGVYSGCPSKASVRLFLEPTEAEWSP